MAKKQNQTEVIKSYALEVDAVIKQSSAIKEQLRTHLERFCNAVEQRFEIIVPISEKEVEKRENFPIPARIRKIKNPKDQRTPKENALIEQFHKDCNDPGECPGEGYKLGNEFYCSEYIKNCPEHIGVRCWLPLEPVNPIGWFPKFDDTSWYENYYDSLTTEQENIRNAVVLAAVHDYGCTGAMEIKDRIIFKDKTYAGKYFERDKFLWHLWLKINDTELYTYLAETALRDIKADLIENDYQKKSEPEKQETEKKQSYTDFLLDMAGQIHPLIRDHKQRFSEQVEQFLSLCREWNHIHEENQRAALENEYLRIPRDMDDYMKPSEIPADYKHHSINDFDWFTIPDGVKWDFWGKPLPFNPLDALIPDEFESLFDASLKHKTKLEKYNNSQEPKDHIFLSNEEELRQSYFLLAVIHANKGSVGAIVNKNDEIAVKVWSWFSNLENANRYWKWWNELKNTVETALDDVKADLEKTIKFTGQKAINELYKHAEELWSMYPFREGKIKAYYFDQNTPQYGFVSPLTTKQIQDIETILESSLELSTLRAFLVQKCHESNLDGLAWRDILCHFQRYNHEQEEIQTQESSIKKISTWTPPKRIYRCKDNR